MANNDRKHIPRFIAPRCGAICYGLFFYHYLPLTEVFHKKVPRTIYSYRYFCFA